MSKMRVPRNGSPAAWTLTAAWLCVCAAAVGCGPQTVPYPIRPRPGRDAGSTPSSSVPTPSASSGSTTPATGAGASAGSGSAGIGMVMTFPVAGSGGFAPASGGTPAAAVGGTSGSVAPIGGAGTNSANMELPPFDAGSDPNRNRAAPGGLCARLATIQCAAEVHCCKAPGRSSAACQSSLQNACESQLYLDVIANNSITGFDAAATVATFTELESRSAQCDVNIPTWSLSSQGVRGILKGTRASGASCKPGTAELTDKAAQAAALASCLNSDVSACLPKSLLGAWTCSPKGAAGSGCATDENCSSGTYCQVPTGATLGTCVQRVPLQGSCSSGAQCSSYFCSGGRCVEPDTQLVFCPAD